MTHHEMKITTNRALLDTDWPHRAECKCGETSGPLWLSFKACLRWYRQHKENTT